MICVADLHEKLADHSLCMSESCNKLTRSAKTWLISQISRLF